MKTILKLLRTLLLVGLTSVILVGCCTMQGSHQNWVFKVEEINAYQQNVEKLINECTSEGWQFVALSTAYNGPSSVAIATLVSCWLANVSEVELQIGSKPATGASQYSCAALRSLPGSYPRRLTFRPVEAPRRKPRIGS